MHSIPGVWDPGDFGPAIGASVVGGVVVSVGVGVVVEGGPSN